MMEFLSGKKTYLVSGCGLLVVAGWMAGAISTDLATQALVALGFGGAITLRAAITKAG